MEKPINEKILFFLCGLLACLSVSHWLSFPKAVDSDYRNVYHMISTIQGFLTCLVAACCFYFVPRLTGSHPLRFRFILIGFTAPVGTTISAWLRFEVPDEIMLAVSMIFWILLLVTLLLIYYPLLDSRNKTSVKLNKIWLFSAVVFGIIGMILVSTYSSIQIVQLREIRWLLFLGRGFLLQGMFLSGYLAVIPILFSNKEPKNRTCNTRNTDNYGFHISAVLFLALSLPAEYWLSARIGFGLRALVVIILFCRMENLRRFPINRFMLYRVIWFSTWAIPLGYIIPMISNSMRDVGLHIVFITGFTIGFLAMILDGILEQYSETWLYYDRPRYIGTFSAVLVLSLIFRIIAEINTDTKIQCLSISAIIFITGVLLWMYVLSRIFKAINRIIPSHSQ